jgi:dTMP kinase
VILPALQSGKTVLCDRYSDATFAYQAAGRGLDPAFVAVANDFCSIRVKPALTILFDLPVEAGLERADRRDARLTDPAAADRFEREKLDFHNRVRQAYLKLSAAEPERFRLIDASRSVGEIADQVRGQVMDFINKQR